ncbi:Alcohol acetyltransferase [Paecilomyces lecythidis]|uniref:Alcohol acetyltransferase n=1 Tax=Paecilomyces lecythidis TaxID=3004212 RepID=A0ABR3YBN5_9EURO
MAPTKQFLRYASPNEQRTISREDAGYYFAVIVGAVYELSDGIASDAPESFFYPLKYCLEKHAWLNVTVGDQHTDKSFYERVPSVNLASHIDIVRDDRVGENDSAAIEELLRQILDQPFPAGIPPWRIAVLPLRPDQCFIAFAYSHMICDGPSGQSFHRTFLEGLRSASGTTASVEPIVNTIERPLPEPFDTPSRLPISWSFLLAPLIATFLPRFLTNLLGLKPQASTTDEGTWLGSRIFFDAKTLRNKIRLREIEAPLLDNAIQVARKRDAKLTGTLQQLIARALSRALPDPTITNFVTQTAVNMRNSVGTPRDEMGEFASGCYVVHPRDASLGPLSEGSWEAARQATRQLAECAATLQDQAIGLLRYLPSIRKWTRGKIGQRRDCSIEISNIGVFDSNPDSGSPPRITKLVFTQPGHVIGPPLAFNFASVKGGGLVYTVTWQAGALGISGDEDNFVDEVCSSLEADFKQLD